MWQFFIEFHIDFTENSFSRRSEVLIQNLFNDFFFLIKSMSNRLVANILLDFSGCFGFTFENYWDFICFFFFWVLASCHPILNKLKDKLKIKSKFKNNLNKSTWNELKFSLIDKKKKRSFHFYNSFFLIANLMEPFRRQIFLFDKIRFKIVV